MTKVIDRKIGQNEQTALWVVRTVGSGAQSVYAYHFPSQNCNEGLPRPTKIGSAKNDVIGRILETQSAMQERPVIDLVIKCSDSTFMERSIHSRLSHKRMTEAFGREWFITTPLEIESCYHSVVNFSELTVGQQIRRFRHQLGYSQIKLSEMAGIRQATLSQIENGSDGVSLKTLNAISEALGMKIRLSS